MLDLGIASNAKSMMQPDVHLVGSKAHDAVWNYIAKQDRRMRLLMSSCVAIAPWQMGPWQQRHYAPDDHQ